MAKSWFDYDEYLQPRHLKGKRHTLTIKRAGEINVEERGNKKSKPILYFNETAKYLFLNKTARLALYEMFGESPAACAGKRITIQAVPLEGRKDHKETIVISPAQSTAPSAALPEDKPAKTDLDRIMDVLEFYEIEDPEVVFKRAITATEGDAAAALAAIEAKYGKLPSGGGGK